MMEERHEIIEFPKNLHMKVLLHQIGSVARHWHRSLELLFVLEGTAHVIMDDQSFLLSGGDIILINSNSIHALYSEQAAVLIALQFKPELFQLGEAVPDNMEFDCNSSVDADPSRYDNIRWAIARMVVNNISREPGTDYLNYSSCYYLLGELVSKFRTSGALSKARLKHTRRLSEIVDYIEAHYKENLNLNDLAASQQLSVPYLSGFFSRYMGVKFSKYYTDVKLNHALQDLISTNHTVERVAVDNGFPEVHTFIRAFKAKFNVTPNLYRKQSLARQLSPGKDCGVSYLSTEPSNYFHTLLKYLSNNSAGTMAAPIAAEHTEQIQVPEINTGKVRRRLTHNFKKVMTVGRARDLLNHDIRNMLRDIQEVIGYQYIKFHGILSDDMMVCMRLPDGTLQFNYQMVDSALEFLLSIGLKPIVQLSFMPAALASDPDKTIFFYHPFNTSPPRDMAEWNRLIADFTRHLIARFGRNEVLSWLFCVWCEPETSAKMFGFGDFPLFCEFYQNTYQTVKSVCPDLRFGSPAFLYMRRHGEPTFLSHFIRYTIESGCCPDFMNIHYYSDIIPRETMDVNLSNALITQLPKEPDDFSIFITSIRALFEKLGVGELPVYLTEWNLTLSHRNLISDTCFKSCYVMKNLLENYDRLDSFGYWHLTDLLEENPLPDNGHIFHGGLGIYTINGTRKSVFYAFDFANRLGDELLAQGEGYFVTRRNERIQIITYHYVHYGDIFAAGDAIGVTATSRYAPFDMSRRAAYTIPLTGLEDGRYIIKEYFVNQEHGSAFDLWVKMGAMPLSAADNKVYQRTCVPSFYSEHLICENGLLTYSPVLEPLEIRFAEIFPESK